MYLSVSTKEPLKLKKNDGFNKVYDSDEEPGLLCDTEDFEDTQYFYEYPLPDLSPPDAGKISLIIKVMNLLQK